MSLKDNFNQALKEVLKRDGLVGENSSKETKKKTELDKYLETPQKPISAEPSFAEELAEKSASAAEGEEFAEAAAAEAVTSPETEAPSSPYVKPEQDVSQFGTGAAPRKTPLSEGTEAQSGVANAEASPFSQFSQYARQSGAAARGEESMRKNSYGENPYNSNAYSGNSYGQEHSYGGSVPPPPTAPRGSSYRRNEPDGPYYETEETTVISRNTIIDGNIRSFANLNIDGSVKGDVKITKNINITGKIVGDIECNNSTMLGASMQGNVMSKGQVQIDRDSLLLGDIAAQYLDLNGKVKGNVDVGGKAEFKTDAVILGNITASTITVLDGATIQGYVNTTFLQESSSSIFPEAIALSE
ncbi:MAG: polymer-forming cytoskeletal protein [Oscillospiraceae bacterium]|nr:polymer-forming cytoskeletal protein [Oscillospiraceae bacterium]